MLYEFISIMKWLCAEGCSSKWSWFNNTTMAAVAELEFQPWVGQGVTKIISGGPQAITHRFFLTDKIIIVSKYCNVLKSTLNM